MKRLLLISQRASRHLGSLDLVGVPAGTALLLGHIISNAHMFLLMLNEMVPLCGQAIDWKKSSILADHGTDTALRDLLEGLADKVKDIDTESLMQYAGILSEGTKGLG